MKPLQAWLRIGPKDQPQWIFVDAADQLRAVAQVLFKRAAAAAQKQLESAGVYRISLTGDLNKPQIEISPLANANENFVLAQVVREADEEVRIVNVRLSPASRGKNTSQLQDADSVSRLVSEAVASRTKTFITGQITPVEISF